MRCRNRRQHNAEEDLRFGASFTAAVAHERSWDLKVRGILKNVMAAGPELRVGGKLLVNGGWLSQR
jgi:hypothetical protein